MLNTIYLIAYFKLYGTLFASYLPVYSVEDTQTKRTGASEKVPASWWGNILEIVWEMGAWGSEAEIHLQETWFTQAHGIPSKRDKQSNLPTFLDHCRNQHLLSSRQEGHSMCWGTTLIHSRVRWALSPAQRQCSSSAPGIRALRGDKEHWYLTPSGEQRTTAIISKRVWNAEMTYCFV